MRWLKKLKRMLKRVGIPVLYPFVAPQRQWFLKNFRNKEFFLFLFFFSKRMLGGWLIDVERCFAFNIYTQLMLISIHLCFKFICYSLKFIFEIYLIWFVMIIIFIWNFLDFFFGLFLVVKEKVIFQLISFQLLYFEFSMFFYAVALAFSFYFCSLIWYF